VGGQLIEVGEFDREPLRARYLVPTAGAEKAPPPHANQEATMTRTLTRWFPILLLRDALGRFMRVRVDQGPEVKRSTRRRSVRRMVAAVQLVLF
jgi:hypothetical protein